MTHRRDARRLAEAFEKNAARYKRGAEMLLLKARHCEESAQVIREDLKPKEVTNAD